MSKGQLILYFDIKWIENSLINGGDVGVEYVKLQIF
jgi:hypothetical protein